MKIESVLINYICSTTLLNLQSQSIVLHIHRIRKHSRLVIGRVIRQAQNDLILTLLQQLGIELELVAKVVTAHRRAHSTRAALVVSLTSQ